MKVWGYILTAVIVAVVVGGGTYLWLRGQCSSIVSDQNKIINANLIPPPTAGQSEDFVQKMASWKEYKSKDGSYSFKYPSDWTVSDDTNGRVGIVTSTEAAAYKKDAENGGPGGPTQVGCELVEIGVGSSSQLDLEKDEINGQISNLQDITFNGSPASFFINPSVCAHYEWTIINGDKIITVGVMTPNDIFLVGVSSLDDYNNALALTYSLTLNK